MTNKLPIKYRPMMESDTSFIYSSWLKSYRNSPFAQHMVNDVYYDNYKLAIKEVLERPTTQVIMACNVDDPDQIFGYVVLEAVGEAKLLHYVYVKYPNRKLGIAKTMLQVAIPEFGQEYTVTSHASHNFSKLANRFMLVYNPF